MKLVKSPPSVPNPNEMEGVRFEEKESFKVVLDGNDLAVHRQRAKGCNLDEMPNTPEPPKV